MKRRKSTSTTKKPSSPSSTKKGKWKKRPPQPKRPRAKGAKLANAFAATKKAWVAPSNFEKWMEDDQIPMRHMPSGRPLGSHCTCKVAPTKYCWKCKGYAQPPEQKQVTLEDLFG